MVKLSKVTICFVLMISFFSMSSCYQSKDIERKKIELNDKARAISKDFEKIRSEIGILAKKIEALYLRQHEILPNIDTSKYELASNGVFYKPKDDGGSAIFVSSYFPMSMHMKEHVYLTEPIDADFKELIKKYPEIVQVYFNDKFSLNRIYPYFDVLSQYEAKMFIPDFNFYYLADKKHNPDKKSIWVNEPYVDPAGRGWMISAIAPVYVGDSLEGVPGIDVTINSITRRYIDDLENSMYLIIDHSGVIVGGQEAVFNMFSFPPLHDHKYIETIKQDTYRKEQYNITLSKDPVVRNIGRQILNEKKPEFEFELKGEKYTLITALIPELNWYILEIIP